MAEVGAHALERGGIAADDERQLTLSDGDGAARHGRVKYRRSTLRDALAQHARHRGADGAHLGPHRSPAEAGQDAVGAEGHVAQRL